MAGLRGLPPLADYVPAEHGVTGLAKTLANELGPHRIRVNSVHPHGVNTDLKPGLRQQLAADEARHVTRIQLPVGLGRTNR